MLTSCQGVIFTTTDCVAEKETGRVGVTNINKSIDIAELENKLWSWQQAWAKYKSC